VEKKKYDLCLEVLRRMKEQGILDKIMLVGSWCVFLYEDYFKSRRLLPALRTRDVEFLFPVPFHLNQKTDLFNLLKDLGFVLDFKGEQGYIVFQHPDLILEFLVPARGRESSKPFTIEQLGINAQPLRFMDALSRNPLQMLFGDVTVTLPHPVDFSLHKLLIAGRRNKKNKAERDRAQAVALLNALNITGDFETVRIVYSEMPKSWRRTIRQELLALGEQKLVELMEEN
jgi:hypothetical protein